MKKFTIKYANGKKEIGVTADRVNQVTKSEKLPFVAIDEHGKVILKKRFRG